MEMGYEITGPSEVAEKIFSGIEAFIGGFRTGQQQASSRQTTPTPAPRSSILPATILGIETNKFLLYGIGTFVVLFGLKLIMRSSGRARRK